MSKPRYKPDCSTEDLVANLLKGGSKVGYQPGTQWIHKDVDIKQVSPDDILTLAGVTREGYFCFEEKPGRRFLSKEYKLYRPKS